MKYVDFGPDDGKLTDPFCLAQTSDGHKGTDFAILDGMAMERGVNVLAAANGTVQKIRDGEPDRWATPEDLKAVQEQRKECGNAILITHENGIKTLYCHLKNGSLTVKPEDKVKTGDVIAKVGLSGFTEFPHVHFGILKGNEILDPFTGLNNDAKECGQIKKEMWQKETIIDYQSLSIMDIGFSNSVPTLRNIEKDSNFANNISLQSDIISFWVTILGAQKGDEIVMEIRDPNGKIYTERKIIQDKTRAKQFYYVGRKTQNTPLIEGAYTGTVQIIRPANTAEENPEKWQKTEAILVKP